MVKKPPNEPIRITTASQCLHEFELLKQALSIEETEDTWQSIDSSLQRFTAAVRGGACDFPDEFLKRWKETEIVRGLVSAMSTERTRLSGTALDLVGATSRLGSCWDSAVPFYVPTIIKLLGRASKIYVTRATITLSSLIKGTKSLLFIPYLIDGISEKSLTIRVGCADALLCCLTDILGDTGPAESGKPKPPGKDGLSKRLNEIENAIKIGGRDRDPKVRATFKRIWELYEQQWPTRATGLAQPFTPTIKRYLGIAPNSTVLSSAPVGPAPPARPQNAHASSNSLLSLETNTNREKGQPSSHQRTDSRHIDSSLPPPAKTINHNSSKSSKPLSSQNAFSKSGDQATLQKAIMVPLPGDELEVREHLLNRGPGRGRIMPSRTKTPSEGSLHSTQPSGSNMKRSNSTMRAQRVPLPSSGDLPVTGANGSTRTATRAPLQPIQSTSHQPKPNPHPKHPNLATSGPVRPQSSARLLVSNSSTHLVKTGFKPTRTTSGTAETDSKLAPQPQPLPQPTTLQTKPLPKRAAPEPPPANDIPASVPVVNQTLNVSVRSNPHSRKVQNQDGASIVKQTRKAFRPTKSCSQGSTHKATDSSTKSSSNPAINSESSPLIASRDDILPLPASKPPVSSQEIPELLQLPASTPLPPSPVPPPASAPTTNLQTDSESLPLELNSTQLESNPGTLPPVKVPPSQQPPSSPRLTSPPDPPPHSGPLATPSPLAEHVAAPDLDALEPSLPAVTLGRTEPQILPSNNSADAVFHSSRSLPLQIPTFPFASTSPGPKICTRLPDDLIIPMSVPLPPSPNSPYLQLGKTISLEINRQPPRTKSTRTRRSTRSNTRSSRSTAKNAVNEANSPKGCAGSLCSPSSPVCGDDETIGDAEVTFTHQPAVPEGILVDFDHEDTIWVPRPPMLHKDLLELDSGLGAGSTTQAESCDEDGPAGKRRRLVDNQPKASSASSNPSPPDVPDSPTDQKTQALPSESSQPVHRRFPRRDPSLFHWNQPRLETEDGNDDSEDRTISCLKEEHPTFLGGDVTVNEGASFYTNFIGGISAQNQSTPASGIVHLERRRIHSSNLPSP